MKSNENPEILRFLQKIGERFKEIRDNLGLTQDEMAETIGVSQNLIFRIEKGQSVSSMMLAYYHFYRNYKINPAWLFAIDDLGEEPYRTFQKDAKRLKDASQAQKSKLLDQLIMQLAEANVQIPGLSLTTTTPTPNPKDSAPGNIEPDPGKG